MAVKVGDEVRSNGKTAQRPEEYRAAGTGCVVKIRSNGRVGVKWPTSRRVRYHNPEFIEKVG